MYKVKVYENAEELIRGLQEIRDREGCYVVIDNDFKRISLSGDESKYFALDDAITVESFILALGESPDIKIHIT